jgi:hypothetical protein
MLHGAAYYETKKGFVKNNNYASIPEIRTVSASGMKKKFFSSTSPLYKMFMKSPEKFKFLNEPEKYAKKMLAVIS